MGAHKKVHIGLITELPGVRHRWTQAKGAEPTADDVARMFAVSCRCGRPVFRSIPN
jgi:hypothetical protein